MQEAIAPEKPKAPVTKPTQPRTRPRRAAESVAAYRDPANPSQELYAELKTQAQTYQPKPDKPKKPVVRGKKVASNIYETIAAILYETEGKFIKSIQESHQNKGAILVSARQVFQQRMATESLMDMSHEDMAVFILKCYQDACLFEGITGLLFVETDLFSGLQVQKDLAPTYTRPKS